LSLIVGKEKGKEGWRKRGRKGKVEDGGWHKFPVRILLQQEIVHILLTLFSD